VIHTLSYLDILGINRLHYVLEAPLRRLLRPVQCGQCPHHVQREHLLRLEQGLYSGHLQDDVVVVLQKLRLCFLQVGFEPLAHFLHTEGESVSEGGLKGLGRHVEDQIVETQLEETLF